MDNDNKIEKTGEIHNEVMLFLGDELTSIHKAKNNQYYDINAEYSKTKKNRSPFVYLVLIACLAGVLSIAFIMHKIISAKNEEITVSLQEFDDLNLKTLLDTVSAAQTNYDNAVKNKSRLETDMETSLKAAADAKENDIFVVDSMHLKYKTVYNDKISVINNQYEQKVNAIHAEYDEKIALAEKEVEEYKAQLAEFDTSKVESARQQEKALDSERQLRDLETQKLKSNYEARIKELEDSITNLRAKNTEDMRKAVAQVSKEYQAQIDALDPTLRDNVATEIMDDAKSYVTPDFNGSALLDENSVASEKVKDFVSDYQEIYDNFRYLDDVVASIPQKNSIPGYVSSARILVNDMGEAFMDSTLAFYEETEELNNQIDGLNDQIDGLNNEINQMNESFDQERQNQKVELKNQQEYYEAPIESLLTIAKTSAIILSASNYDDIKVYVAAKARYLIGEEGAAAEIRIGKGIKGTILRNTENDSFNFVVSADKDGNLPEVDFTAIEPGSLVKILSK